MNKIKIDEVKNTDHIGILYNSGRYKLVASTKDKNKFIAMKAGETSTDEGRKWSESSKSQYLIKAKKNTSIKEAKIFEMEEQLNEWLREKD